MERAIRAAWAWVLATSRRRLLLVSFVGGIVVVSPAVVGLMGFGRPVPAPVTAVSEAELMGQAVTGDVGALRDPYIVAEDGVLYLFSTGEGIPVRRSDDGQRWEQVGEVFPSGLPDWTGEVAPGVAAAWAPALVYLEERWHLYYAVSTFGTWSSAVGLATSPTLDPDDPDHGWTDHGVVVRSEHDEVVGAVGTPGGEGAWNAIDPYPVLDEGGDPWLAWGSFAGGIYLRRLDPETGRFDSDAPVHHLARRPSAVDGIEAANLVEREGIWYLFTSWDFCCRGVQSTYTVRVGRASSLTGPYVDHRDQSLLEGGGSLVLGAYDDVVGPGHTAVVGEGDDWFLAHHFYDGTNDGTPTLSIRPLLWTSDGWPVAADPGFAPAGSDLSRTDVAGSWEVSGYDEEHPTVAHAPVRFDLDEDGEVGAGAGTWELNEGVVTITARPDCDDRERTYELFVDEPAGQMHGRTDDGAALRAHRIEPSEAPSPSCE